ncbi:MULTISPECIES: aminotransferase-like domain-containing protein [Bradyrhizobium]|uniref:aminotransferase-like domain-containing protein n=1 Tax=Bradyrhizobium centrosematis TaxID=1300039 RepID=UPI0021695E3C|nr:PLP-dependent aminotransferase family protein [Bradyrhizobium centrosematis]MCS3764770.1 DNA-binding transcriptional MocR family regulator [Bradyrhizobium centrosematis]MCS3776178.1 DNA-binding transcriptional MocR family regulator [Bradyrhizobium centrosematis]
MSKDSYIPNAPISLERSTPPASLNLRSTVKEGLRALSDLTEIHNVLRKHRFSGTEADKAHAAEWLASRFETPVDPKRVILTNGAQNAMVLALASVAGPGDTVLMETLSYHGFRKQAHVQGIRTKIIAMDNDGAEPEAFEKACREFAPKALFLMPTVHNPTTIVMSMQRRQDIARIARQYGVSIIEDDVYGLLPEDVPAPFGALASDITWHITSFAKCVGAGVRVGYLVAPDANAAQKTLDRFYGISSWYPASVSVELVNLWLANGSMEKMVAGVRQEAIARQRIAADCLANVPFQTRPDALFLWVNLEGIIDQDELVAQCASRNVIIRPGRLFATDPKSSLNYVRIVIGSPDSRDDLKAAMAVVGGLLQTARDLGPVSGVYQ